MQHNNQTYHVRGGKNAKPNQHWQASKRARGKSKEKGYPQVDEMKLKHGFYWNTQTGEAVKIKIHMFTSQYPRH